MTIYNNQLTVMCTTNGLPKQKSTIVNNCLLYDKGMLCFPAIVTIKTIDVTDGSCEIA